MILQDLMVYLITFILYKLYLSFETSSPEDLSTCTSALEDCVKDIDLWMLNNKLKLNSGKTEIIVFSSSYRPRPAFKKPGDCL